MPLSKEEILFIGNPSGSLDSNKIIVTYCPPNSVNIYRQVKDIYDGENFKENSSTTYKYLISSATNGAKNLNLAIKLFKVNNHLLLFYTSHYLQ